LSAMRRLPARHQTQFLQFQRLAHIQCGPQVAEVDRIEGAAENPYHGVGGRRLERIGIDWDKTTRLLLSDLTLTQHHVLLRGQAFQADRTAGVNLIGADADLRAETVLKAVGEAC
jgi:hypothetical protein